MNVLGGGWKRMEELQRGAARLGDEQWPDIRTHAAGGAGRGAGCLRAKGSTSGKTRVTSEMEEPQHGAAYGCNQKTQGEQQSELPHALAQVPERAFLLLAF